MLTQLARNLFRKRLSDRLVKWRTLEWAHKYNQRSVMEEASVSRFEEDILRLEAACQEEGRALLGELETFTQENLKAQREIKQNFLKELGGLYNGATQSDQEAKDELERQLRKLTVKHSNYATCKWEDAAWLSIEVPECSSDLYAIGAIGGIGVTAYTKNPAKESLLIGDNLEDGVKLVEGLLVRALAEQPGLRVSVIDHENNGVSLAKFGKARTDQKGFMAPTSVKPSEINATLERMSQRISFVAQTMLQGTSKNIHEYNQGSQIQEDINLLIVISPETLSDAQIRELEKVARTGPDCGVNVLRLVTRDVLKVAEMTSEARDAYGYFNMDIAWRKILLNSNTTPVAALVYQPLEEVPVSLVHRVVEHAEKTLAKREESKVIKLSDFLPARWERPDNALRATIGVAGTSGCVLELGVSGAHPHLLIAGRTGTGKSTLLHTLICSLAAKYSPQDLQFYLVDAKQGVEMRNYTPGSPSLPAGVSLPHLKLAAVKSDIRTYISVLEELQKEIGRRGRICSASGASDIVELERREPTARMPRLVAIFDEFHVMLTDPQFGAQASELLKYVAKQGRAFGIHLVLATQSLGNLGARGENAALFEQLGNRIALACDPNVSEMVLGIGNLEASKLNRRGEAILTTNPGDRTQNVKFGVAFIDPVKERPAFVTSLASRAQVEGIQIEDPFVFIGEGLPRIGKENITREPDGRRNLMRALVGIPVKVAPPVAVRIEKNTGGNLLIYGAGNHDRSDISGVISSVALGCIKTMQEKIIVLMPDEEEKIYEYMHLMVRSLQRLGLDVQSVEPGRQVSEALEKLTAQIAQAESMEKPTTLLIIPDGDSTLSAKAIEKIVTEGPKLGIHTIGAFASKRGLTAATGTNTLEKALSLFDTRIFAILGAEASASTLGLPEKPANEDERFTLWEARKPNQVSIFIPYEAPDVTDWEDIISMIGQVK